MHGFEGRTPVALLLTILTILSIIAILYFERKNYESAAGWVMIVAALPGLGLLLYLIFGDTMRYKLNRLFTSRRLEKRYGFSQKLMLLSRTDRLNTSRDYDDMITFNFRYNRSVLSFGNDAQIFTGGEEKFAALFEDIRNARYSVNVLYYGFHQDAVGRSLVNLLTEKAGAGVKVNLMFDGVGSFFTPNRFFRELTEAGGRLCRCRPGLFDINFRNHRKIVTIDGRIAYTGGMNVGDKYIGRHRVKSPWRDTQVRITGPAVSQLQAVFFEDWMCQNRPKKLEGLYNELSLYFPKEEHPGDYAVQIVHGGPESDKESIKMSYLKMITSARKQLLIQSPYVIPDSSILDALRLSAASGVDVRIMIPAVSGSFFLKYATDYYLDKLLDAGISVYRYHGYVHAKTMVCDGEIACIGSANLDMRSFRYDDEICAYFYDADFAQENVDVFEEDLRACDQMRYEEFKRRGVWRKFLEGVMHIFAPLM